MTKTIRQLTADDYLLVESMDTGMEEDYVIRIFERLISGKNYLYGLFVQDKLVSFGGYSLFNHLYAMIGRLRSDRHYRSKDYATELMNYIISQAFESHHVEWVGANTQENNLPARRVLEKLGLSPYPALHGAITKSITPLVAGNKVWNQVLDINSKKKWLSNEFIQTKALFPYECFYPFPATWHLFQDDEIAQWNFYENESKTRCLITKPDQKGHHYLQVIYPWSDFMKQAGFWETISYDYQQVITRQSDSEMETYIWIDLTKEEVSHLPKNHPFELASPWILHGINKSNWNTKHGTCETPFHY